LISDRFAIPQLRAAAFPGPVFYRHKRIGHKGKAFNFFKFRTMVINADEILEKIKHLTEREGPVFKMKNDPRITRIGRILRRYSIDELPQLFNIFMGHMSLVGPRPPLPREVLKFEPWQHRKLSVRPGLTCIWQVSGRNRLSYAERVRLDVFYVCNWSVWLDLHLILRTARAVLGGRGAS
jgi:lipopolysaccharide/colanic/teichoic acid biosynthesis glycosyltransferase